jgi:hypothetical protein
MGLAMVLVSGWIESCSWEDLMLEVGGDDDDVDESRFGLMEYGEAEQDRKAVAAAPNVLSRRANQRLQNSRSGPSNVTPSRITIVSRNVHLWTWTVLSPLARPNTSSCGSVGFCTYRIRLTLDTGVRP